MVHKYCRNCAEFDSPTNGWCYPYKREHGDHFPKERCDYVCEEWNPKVTEWGWGVARWTENGKLSSKSIRFAEDQQKNWRKLQSERLKELFG